MARHLTLFRAERAAALPHRNLTRCSRPCEDFQRLHGSLCRASTGQAAGVRGEGRSLETAVQITRAKIGPQDRRSRARAVGPLVLGLNHPLDVREERLTTRSDACRLAYASDLHLRRGRSDRWCRQVTDAVTRADPPAPATSNVGRAARAWGVRPRCRRLSRDTCDTVGSSPERVATRQGPSSEEDRLPVVRALVA